eukprot:g60953.t1
MPKTRGSGGKKGGPTRIMYDEGKPLPAPPGKCHHLFTSVVQLATLTKKNFILRRRDWVITCTELFVPVIVMLALLATSTSNTVPAKVPYPYMLNEILYPHSDQFRLMPRPNETNITLFELYIEALRSGTHNMTTEMWQGVMQRCKESEVTNYSMTMIEMVTCGYSFGITPANSSAAQRLYEMLLALDPLWKQGAYFFENKSALLNMLTQSSYPQNMPDGKYMFFAVDFAQEGPNWSYTLLGNTTAGTAGSPGPTLPRIPKLSNVQSFAKNGTEWQVYGRGFIQLQYLIDNFVIIDPDMPPVLAAQYWLRWIVDQRINLTWADIINYTNPNQNFTFTTLWDHTTIRLAIHKYLNFVSNETNRTIIPRPYVQELAYDSYTFNLLLEKMGEYYGAIFAATLIWPVTQIAKTLIEEKENRIVQGLMMMGTKYKAIWGSWFIFYSTLFLIMTLLIILPSCLAKNALFPNTDPGILFLLFWSMGMATWSFAFAWSSIFSKARLGMALVAMLFFVAQLTDQAVDPQTMPTVSIAFISLIPNVAFSQGMRAVIQYEKFASPCTFENWDTLTPFWSAAYSFMMLVIDIFFWIFVGLYLDSIIQKDFGVALPWYWPVWPDYWRRRCGRSETAAAKTKSSFPDEADYTIVYEGATKPAIVEQLTPEQHAKRAVKIRKLRKIFHEGSADLEVKALKGLDLDLIEGEILVLLGHNGAGKSTTISMLTGLYPPSMGGDATVYGKSITYDMTEIRKRYLGVCPQHDILYPQLSVKEHLVMYAHLKGVELQNVDKDVDEMIQQVGLTEKVNAAAGTLSGGMKRKLSIGMAFIGNSKVVFLDEPTSGMDPYSRRSTWDLLKHARKGRVIVLTTHFMDEADYLGDRIAIMGKGRLICCGSTLFLKGHYGVGYNMTVTKRNATAASNERLANTVKKYVPEFSVLNESAGEISYRLPLRCSEKFADLFDAIDKDRKQLAVDTYGMSVTTLEEVFLRVGAEDELITSEEAAKAKKTMKHKLAVKRQQTLRALARAGTPKHTGLSLDALIRQESLPGIRKSPQNLVANPPQPPQPQNLSAKQPENLSANDFANAGEEETEKEEKININYLPTPSPMDDAGAVSVSINDPKPFNDADGSPGGGEEEEEAESPVHIDLVTPERLQLSAAGWFCLHTYAMVLKRFHNAKRDTRSLMCAMLLPVLIVLIGTIITVTTQTPNPPNIIEVSWQQDQPPISGYSTQGELAFFSNNFIFNNEWEEYGVYAQHFMRNTAPVMQSVPSQAPNNFNISFDLRESIPNRSNADHAYGGFGFSYDTPFAWEFPPSKNTIAEIQEEYGFNNPEEMTYVPPYGHEIPFSFLVPNEDQQMTADQEFPTNGTTSRQADTFRVTPNSSGWGDVMTVAILFNSTTTSALPVYMNAFTSTLFRNLNERHIEGKSSSNSSTTPSISIFQEDFPKTQIQMNQKKALLQSFFIAMAFTWVPAGYGSYVVLERECKSKHQQFMSGVKPGAYWFAHLCWDLLSFCIPLICTLIIVAAFKLSALTVQLGNFTLNLIIFNLSVSMWAYALSFMFEKSSSAEATLRMIFVLTGPCLMFVDVILRTQHIQVETDVLQYIWRLCPTFAFSQSIYNLQMLTAENRSLGWQMDVTGWNFVYMTVTGFLNYFIVLLIEYVQRTASLLKHCQGSLDIDSPPEVYKDLDEDITAEVARVNDPNNTSTDIVRITHLRKVYAPRLNAGPKIAVHDLSFGIPAGECFGFLGINGAGKTTTMEMLTSDQLPTSGTAYLNGLNILTSQEEIRKQIGYCPQFDALIGNLTSSETLYLYGRLKGIPERHLPEYVNRMIKLLSLSPFADKPCGGYSGGNKRKLSVGMAMIGSPKILFLDEPSTGMDPKSRRFMWELIASTMIGRSVILTTHAMEEAEALCTRLGIMVGGRLRCLGSPQHLKSRYGAGYQIDINVLEGRQESVDIWLRQSVSSDCVKIEEHGTSLKYRLPPTLTLGYLFRLVEEKKTQLGIVEYSLAETSLEQIFIHFARQQAEEKGSVAGLGNVVAPEEDCNLSKDFRVTLTTARTIL